MKTEGAPSRRGRIEEAALGLAEVVIGSPKLCAAVLLASTVIFPEVRWCLVAGVLAGIGLARTSRTTQWVAVIAVCAATFAFSNAWGRHVDPALPIGIARETIVPLGLVLFALGWSTRTPLVASAGAFAAALVTILDAARNDGSAWEQPLLYTGSTVLLFSLGTKGWPRIGIVVALCVTAFCIWQSVAELIAYGVLSVRTGAMEIVSFALLGMLEAGVVVAGLALRRSREAAASGGPARLLVICQTHPWLVVPALSILVLFTGPGCFPARFPEESRTDWIESMMRLSAGSFLLAALASNSRAPLARLAPLVVATICLVTTRLAPGLPPSMMIGRSDFPTSVAVALLLPVAVVKFVPRASCGLRMPPLVAAAVAAELVLVFATTAHVTGPSHLLGSDPSWAWLAVAPLGFAVAMATQIPSAWMVAGATLLGALAAFGCALGDGGANRDACRRVLGAWFLAGVYVVVARAARSLTAIPADHPVLADFGGRP
jgi:hypothetical protein